MARQGQIQNLLEKLHILTKYHLATFIFEHDPSTLMDDGP